MFCRGCRGRYPRPFVFVCFADAPLMYVVLVCSVFCFSGCACPLVCGCACPLVCVCMRASVMFSCGNPCRAVTTRRIVSRNRGNVRRRDEGRGENKKETVSVFSRWSGRSAWYARRTSGSYKRRQRQRARDADDNNILGHNFVFFLFFLTQIDISIGPGATKQYPFSTPISGQRPPGSVPVAALIGPWSAHRNV